MASSLTPRDRAAQRPCELLQKRVHEQRDVVAPLAQRRNPDVEDLQAIVQILAEVAAFHRLAQVAVGRGDHTGVGLDRPGRAQPLEFALLQDAQELGLRRRAHLAHLVEKQDARRRQLDLPGLALMRARERATLVAKQLRFEERLRQGGAVDRAQTGHPCAARSDG